MGLSFSRRRHKLQNSENASKNILVGEVCLDHFDILRSIGRGSFGKVCIVQKKDTGKLYALKYMSKTKCYNQGALNNVLKELEIMKRVKHNFLVNLWFAFQDEEDMFMVLDLMIGGDIRFHLNEGRRFTEQQVLMYVAEITLALNYLWENRIVHRDIKPDNLLLDDKGHIHITDFNIATILKEGYCATSLSGTKAYMAPEVFATCLKKSKGYSYEIDWWSLGVTICEMIRGKRPFNIHSETNIADAYKIFTSELVLELPTTISDSAVRLLKKLLQPDPKKRLCNIENVQMHVSMESLDFDEIEKKEVLMSFIPARDHLNCDPTYELEEMIIESKPLHKKKKRLHRKVSKKTSVDTLQSSSSTDPYIMELERLKTDFSIFDRNRMESVRVPQKLSSNMSTGAPVVDNGSSLASSEEPEVEKRNTIDVQEMEK